MAKIKVVNTNLLYAMYMDKLDGRIDENFFDQKSKEWKQEQYDIFRKIERHQRADRSYMEEGVKLLELAQRAVTLYEKQNMREKRRIINFVCSNSPWKDGRLLPNYRKPFDILSETNRLYKRKKAIFSKKNDRFDIWLLGWDSNHACGVTGHNPAAGGINSHHYPGEIDEFLFF